MRGLYNYHGVQEEERICLDGDEFTADLPPSFRVTITVAQPPVPGTYWIR